MSPSDQKGEPESVACPVFLFADRGNYEQGMRQSILHWDLKFIHARQDGNKERLFYSLLGEEHHGFNQDLNEVACHY